VKEDSVRFRSGEWEIPYHPGDSARAVAITHPHPQYGGDMFNPVVAAIVSAYQKQGLPRCGLISEERETAAAPTIRASANRPM
jgi:alpha/beta superfamily hydrolase